MASTQEDTLRTYVGDLIAVLDHVSKAIEKQKKEDGMKHVASVGALLQTISVVLTNQHQALVKHSQALGGATGGGMIKDALMTVTGALAGLYGNLRGETASRMLRDDYTALSFLSICTTMLHTTALALNDSATSTLTLGFMREYPPLIMSVSVLVPQAVVADLSFDKIVMSHPGAAESAVHDLNEAWRHRS